jgi:hypothetical protein
VIVNLLEVERYEAAVGLVATSPAAASPLMDPGWPHNWRRGGPAVLAGGTQLKVVPCRWRATRAGHRYLAGRVGYRTRLTANRAGTWVEFLGSRVATTRRLIRRVPWRLHMHTAPTSAFVASVNQKSPNGG